MMPPAWGITMNRREIIVVVAIVNIALLSLLFVTAQRVDAPLTQSLTVTPQAHETIQVTPSIAAVPAAAQPAVVSDIPVDEVDSVLRDFAAAVAASHHKQPAASSLSLAVTNITQQPSSEPSSSNSVRAKEESLLSYNEVVVKRGDFLERIARQQGSTIEAIKQANHLTSDHLKVGQILRIPAVAKADKVELPVVATAPVDKPATLIATSEEYQMYRVKSGDSPWKIAKQFQVDVEYLLRLNNLDEDSARNLKPGDTIRVR
jgi:peptidoglycan endopeptidase LytF